MALVIIWHSRTGAARAMAAAASEAAQTAEPAFPVRMIAAVAATPADLRSASGAIFCCPENLATMSGEMKAFFDRCYYPLLGQIEGRAYGAMIAAGSDGSGALQQMERILKGWRMRSVVDPVIINTSAQTMAEILAEKQLSPASLSPCRNMGAAMASGLAMGVF